MPSLDERDVITEQLLSSAAADTEAALSPEQLSSRGPEQLSS